MPFFPWKSPFTTELYSSLDAAYLLPHVGIDRAFMEDGSIMHATMIQSWFWECFQNLPRCGPQLQPLPPRVIDVGTLKSPTLRLYETREDNGAYVVLSHSPKWPRALRTTAENLSDHIDGIHSFGLPHPIFRDTAIRIDIRQARFVIGARAENGIGDSGLFPDPNMYNNVTIYHRYGSYAVQVRLLRKSHGNVCGTFRPVKYDLSWFWDLQDQLLSSRMVHYTDSEFIWEYRCRVACQCTPGSRGFGNRLYLKAWYNRLTGCTLQDHDAGVEIYKFWFRHSSEDLGIGPSDTEEILAQASRHKALKKRTASRIAYPHKSYVPSLDSGQPGPTSELSNRVHRNPATMYAEALQMVAYPIGNDRFGPVSSAHVTLRGQLIEMTYLGQPITLHESIKAGKSRWICKLHPNGIYIYGALDFYPTSEEARRGLLLLLIAKESYSKGSKTKKRVHWSYNGLILMKHARDRGLWERVGVWKVPISKEQNDTKTENFFPTSYKGAVSIAQSASRCERWEA
ncbi:uncharacterized protein PAC_03890 [Phialocephala subalpina]|uniref:Heterokaryon incompatibility domain-containing protein n=1 Tax=Phialocephala subalpina TaxID=576137 RepID=A0A1L7WMK6_9HELO|nr:uncharacterized protein PAC_03890 [Phialocephala subalpina]